MSAWDDARRKIERANEHIRDIKARIVALHETDTARVENHPKFGTERLIHEFTDTKAFDDFAVMIGDAIHNLNCALDYAWLETAKRLVPSIISERTKLPVRKSRDELEGWLKKPGKNIPAILDVSPELSNFLLNDIRPYRGGNRAIWPIHVLDNIDKHRLLIPILSSVYLEGIVAVDDDGNLWPGYGFSHPMYPQKPPYVIDIDPGAKFKEYGHLTATIIVKNRQLQYGVRVPETLLDYSQLIVKVVELFEEFVESRP
jgi:hypothetical protein